MNPVEQKLAQQLGAQQLEIMKLQAVVEEAQKEIVRLRALVPKDEPKIPSVPPPPPTNGHDAEPAKRLM